MTDPAGLDGGLAAAHGFRVTVLFPGPSRDRFQRHHDVGRVSENLGTQGGVDRDIQGTWSSKALVGFRRELRPRKIKD
jgi:hypothetical protein